MTTLRIHYILAIFTILAVAPLGAQSPDTKVEKKLDQIIEKIDTATVKLDSLIPAPQSSPATQSTEPSPTTTSAAVMAIVAVS